MNDARDVCGGSTKAVPNIPSRLNQSALTSQSAQSQQNHLHLSNAIILEFV
jgi:hypothetical protein